MESTKDLAWIEELESEEIDFIKKFILASGSLKELGKIYDVSYPTVRLRLDKIIQKININERKEDEPYIKFIKKLAIDDKLDVAIAKQIITEYKKNIKEDKDVIN